VIVKFHARGTGAGSGPVGYLLGRNNDREDAWVLRGDPEQTEALIDGSQYAKRYTSGVLSFQESQISEKAKREIMDSFEKALMPGLDADQYDCLWVEHADKGRVELNFVIPNVELTSGKRLQPYYDRADRPRVDAWKTVTNARYNFHDPNDPANQRALTTPSNLPRERATAQRQITDGLLRLASEGEVTNREEVVRALEDTGFEVTRQTKSSISVADPEGGKPIRLRGKLYERDFEVGSSLRAEIDRASREYREGREERFREARERLAVGVERKREENQRRYPRPEPAIAAHRAQKLDVHRDSAGHDRTLGSGIERPDGQVHHAPDRTDRQLQPDAGEARRRGEQDHADALRREQEALREDRRRQREIRQRGRRQIPHSGRVLDDDGSGTRAVTGFRAIAERLQQAAARVGERLREFAEHVRGDTPRQSRPGRASEALGRASLELEQSEERENRATREAGHSLERAGRGLEREREALDARGKETLKQHSRKARDRGHDHGMSM